MKIYILSLIYNYYFGCFVFPTRHKFKRWAFPRIQETWQSDLSPDPWGVRRPLRFGVLQTAGGSRESPYCVQREAVLWHDD